jgi:hypothetical protein
MDSDTFVNTKILIAVAKEFANSTYDGYKEFIVSKDFGIVHIEGNIYKIIDEKKWLLAKLKYGL